MKKVIPIILVSSLLILSASDSNITNDSANVKSEFAQKWAELSVKMKGSKNDPSLNSPAPFQAPIPDLVDTPDEEAQKQKENRIMQEEDSIFSKKLKMDATKAEMKNVVTLELEPQYIKVAGRSEYYITYKQLLEAKLYFSTQKQNKYTLAQLSITNQELTNIQQELQLMTQQNQTVGFGGTSDSIFTSKVSKKEKLWSNKNYGYFKVKSLDKNIVVFEGM